MSRFSDANWRLAAPTSDWPIAALGRVKLLILDDWGPETLSPEQARDLLEIVEDRYDAGSLLITSQAGRSLA